MRPPRGTATPQGPRRRATFPPPDPQLRQEMIDAGIIRPGGSEMTEDIGAGPVLALDRLAIEAAERAIRHGKSERGPWRDVPR